jgi:hypothetical protein
MNKSLFAFAILFGCQTLEYQAPRAWELTSMAYMPFSEQLTQAQRVDYMGVATLPRQSSRTLLFRPRYQPREFMLFTCAREVVFEAPTKEIRYVYTPMWGVENEEACPLYAVSISTEGRRETAVIDFNNGLTGKARIYCNGQTIDATGAYMCQVRESFFLGAKFTSSMEVEADKGCPEPIRKLFYEWEIRAGKGHCTYYFGDTPQNLFRLTVRGYESILEVTK